MVNNLKEIYENPILRIVIFLFLSYLIGYGLGKLYSTLTNI